MSDNTQETGNTVANNVVESGTYAAQRVKQEVDAETTRGADQSYVNQAKGVASSAIDTARPYVDQSIKKVQSLTTNIQEKATQAEDTTKPTGSSTQESLHGTLAGQARGLAEQVVTSAQPYVDAGIKQAQILTTGVKQSAEAATKQASEAVDDLQTQAGEQTDVAVAEGQRDSEEIKATAASYLDQAKSLAGAALGSAHGYLQAGQERIGGAQDAVNDRTAARPGVLFGTLQYTAATILDTTAHYVQVAQSSIQPHVDAVKQAAEPHVRSAQAKVSEGQEAVQPHVDAAKQSIDPHVQAASDAAQPAIHKAKESFGDIKSRADTHVQPAHDQATRKIDHEIETAKPKIQSAQETVQPHIDASSPPASK